MTKQTTNQIEDLTIAINSLSEAIWDLKDAHGQMTNWTIADCLEAIAMEMNRANDLKETTKGESA